MMAFGMATQTAPVVWGIVAMLLAAGLGILSMVEPRELGWLRRVTTWTRRQMPSGAMPFGAAARS